MSLRVDSEQLMMDALDGTISDRDHKALQAYFATHPEESAIFERMWDVDQALRAVPPAIPPMTMTPQVMDAVSRAYMAKPPLRTSQIALLICITSILLVLAGLIVLGLYLLLSAIVPPDGVQAVFTFLRGLADVGQGLLGAMAAFLRAAFTQPIAWLATLCLAGVVMAWLRIMLAVLAPSLRLISASV